METANNKYVKKSSLRLLNTFGHFSIIVPVADLNINDFTDEICNYLSQNRFSDKLIYEYRLLIEETLIKVVKKAKADSELTCEVKKIFGKITVDLVYNGNAILAYQEDPSDYGGMILEDYTKNINVSQVYGFTKINLSFNTPSHNTKNSALALVLAIPFAYLLTNIFDSSQLDFIENSIVMPLIKLFFNALQAISLPLVFLSLLSNAVELIVSTRRNRSLQKLLTNYMISSVVCIVLAFLSCFAINELNILAYSSLFQGKEISLFGETIDEVIINVMPNNITNIFLSNNPIPLLIFTGLLGISINKLRQNDVETIFNMLTPLKNLFSGIMDLLLHFLPAVVFFAVVDEIIYYYLLDDLTVLLPFDYLSIFTLPIVLIFIFYSIILRISGISPIQFIKDHKEILRSNIQIGSSEDALYYNVRYFSPILKNNRKDLIDRFRLGAIFNMDGTSALSAAAIFTLCYMCYIPLNIGQVILVIFIILLLAPQNGGLLISSVVLMSFLGISMDLLSDIVLIEAFFGGIYNALNSLGDIVAIVAGSTMKKQNSGTD